MCVTYDTRTNAGLRASRGPSAGISSPLTRRRGATPREWLYLVAQVGLVAGIELGDDALHAAAPQVNAASGLANALRIVDFEQVHGLWIEPGLQQFFLDSHHVAGLTMTWAQVRPLFDALYGQGHVLFTLLFACWVYFRRRSLFSFIRNVFALTSAAAVVIYEAFPLAPPRLARGLRYDGHPYHFLDAVFGSGGIKLSFNEYAAMPSVHVAWALIVGLTLWWTARPWIVRILGLIYPVVMLTTVIVTGNHYLSDGMGALAVVSLAVVLSVLIARRGQHQSLMATLRRLHGLRYWRDGSGAETAPARAAVEQRIAA